MAIPSRATLTSTPDFVLDVEIEDFSLQKCTFTCNIVLLATFELHANFRYTLPDAWKPSATQPRVREKLIALQQQIARDQDVVMEGRDIGTVVFPQADLKVVLTASAEARAMRLDLPTPEEPASPLRDVDRIVQQRKQEADEFYASVHPPEASEDERRIQRQALAGMLWSKQIYLFDVNRWLVGDNPNWPPGDERCSPTEQDVRAYYQARVQSGPGPATVPP